ncbi:hypothetical protein B9Z55_012701 [Caenorhabditis nigoni]|uniref:Uncharacterized protein n=1 Tax=Caenorhabditis nigoni TaxID=1611254 RepID=A0A2G5TYK2_9PELO|nr:hypothetical protein B9Z55_012701 [Caenorhabditis nigoni]
MDKVGDHFCEKEREKDKSKLDNPRDKANIACKKGFGCAGKRYICRYVVATLMRQRDVHSRFLCHPPRSSSRMPFVRREKNNYRMDDD